jgi:hypothetical protein
LVSDFFSQKARTMLACLLLSTFSAHYSFTINHTASSFLTIDTNDDIFFSLPIPHSLFVIRSGRENVIASVNQHASNSTSNLGYLSGPTRHFGVYLGATPGSISVFCRRQTVFSFTVVVLPSDCTRLSLSTAPVDLFQIGGSNQPSLIPHTNDCYCYVSWVPARAQINFRTGVDVSLTTLTDDQAPHLFVGSTHLQEIIQGSLIVVFSQFDAPRDASLFVCVANLTGVPGNNAAQTSIVSPNASLFLMDDGRPWPPQPLDPATAPPAGPGDAWLEALESGFAFIMLNVSFCCMFIIIVALLLVAIIKRQRKNRERAREREPSDRRHISAASRSVPRILIQESTAQLAHGLLGATESQV